MTPSSLSSPPSRTRAGILILALALIGGMGCAAVEAVGDARYASQQRALLQERQRRVAELTPAAQAGDPQAMVALAHAILATRQDQDVPRALDWLSRAAEQDYGPAQAVLGDMLASGYDNFGSFLIVPAALRNRERGFALLRKAASQACRFNVAGEYTGHILYVDPALRISDYLRQHGQAEQGRVWRARSVMHCGLPTAASTARYLTMAHPTPETQVEQFALLLLSGDVDAISAARPTLTPENIAAAEREAADLRRRVAESERAYPAPKQKEFR